MPTASRSFAPTKAAPRLCRRFVRETLAVLHARQLTGVAELVVSELATSLVDAVEPITINLTWTPASVRVELSNRSLSVPSLVDRLHGVSEVIAGCRVTEHNDGNAVLIDIEHA